MITYKKHGSFFFRFIDGQFEASIPDDMGNRDRQELQAWLDAGNELEEDAPAQPQSSYNWQGLAIAFKLSELNQILNQLKDEGKNPQINAIWRISDELVQVITLPVFSESDRVAGMTRDIQDLFQKLEEGKVQVPSSAKDEIIEALMQSGFTEVASALAQNSVI